MLPLAVSYPSEGRPTPNCPGRWAGGWAHFPVRLAGGLPLLAAGSGLRPWPSPLLHLLQRQRLEVHRIKDLAEHLGHVIHGGLERREMGMHTEVGQVPPSPPSPARRSGPLSIGCAAPAAAADCPRELAGDAELLTLGRNIQRWSVVATQVDWSVGVIGGEVINVGVAAYLE